MKNNLSFLKIVVLVLPMYLIFSSENVQAVGNNLNMQSITDGDLQMMNNEEVTKREMQEIKKVITLTKEQEVALYDLLFFKNDTLALPDQSSPRVSTALQRVSEEIAKILTKQQIQALKGQKALVSSLKLDFK